MQTIKIIIATTVIALANTAAADPIVEGQTYELGNHPYGAVRTPYYGLRLDGLLSGDQSDIYTFDFEAPGALMQLLWTDLGAPGGLDSTIRIWGNAYGGLDIGSSYQDPTWWDIDFLYEGVAACTTGSDNVCASYGSGTISSSTYGSFDLYAVSGSHSYAFQMDEGHRLSSGDDTLTGWGWVNHCPSRGNDIDGGNCEVHLYSSDWLFTAKPTRVPEPGTLALFGLGLVGLSIARRRRTI